MLKFIKINPGFAFKSILTSEFWIRLQRENLNNK